MSGHPNSCSQNVVPIGRKMVLLLLAVIATRVAALDWPATAIELKTDGDQKEVVTVFPFRNISPRSVQIISVAASCECLSVKPTKEIVAPGDTGELRVQFALGGRTGRQERTIMVTSDDAPDAPTVLTLVVKIGV
jgi:hypothetical protein